MRIYAIRTADFDDKNTQKSTYGYKTRARAD